MTNEMPLRVSMPPSQPLLIWDGDCHFCRRWIERWQVISQGEVEYLPSQEIGDRFPEISREEFQRSVVFVNTNGEVFFGAEAIYHSLGRLRMRRWLTWSYDHVPGFAAISDFFYQEIARHRRAASAVTRWLWGDDVRPPTYYWARTWFLRALGVVYLIAFISLWVQIDGLIGANGILPVREFLALVHERLGLGGVRLLPTLCWFNSSNAFLYLLCGAGVLSSLLVLFDLIPAIGLGLSFVFYLSLTLAGQAFLSFQWDILLLETGFLAIFFAPWKIWSHNSTASGSQVSRPALFLLKLLLFKLMLMSGIVKLTSGDPSWGWANHGLHWSAMTALDYHYWSQPLPTIFAWYADKSPEWFKHLSVAVCLFVEIVVPFFIWAPRRLRLIACGLLIFLQLAIAVTGNYCFFNLLTIALCLPLIDDGLVGRRRCDARQVGGGTGVVVSHNRLPVFCAVAVMIVTLPINVWLIYSAFFPEAEPPRPVRFLSEQIDPFRMVNGYGLFRVMTKDRGEIEIQGSANGADWQSYAFRWKPGDVTKAPRWCAPHQPRLDWQMWFAALGSYRENPWFVRLLVRLLEGQTDVTKLFARNPFPEVPPRYVRAVFYRYRFTEVDERRRTGAWWKREKLGEYFPPFSLNDLKQEP